MTDKIIIKGAKEHNLKNIDVEIPRDKFEKKRIYDVSNFAVYPEWRDGENILEIKLDCALWGSYDTKKLTLGFLFVAAHALTLGRFFLFLLHKYIILPLCQS